MSTAAKWHAASTYIEMVFCQIFSHSLEISVSIAGQTTSMDERVAFSPSTYKLGDLLYRIHRQWRGGRVSRKHQTLNFNKGLQFFAIVGLRRETIRKCHDTVQQSVLVR